MDIINGIIKKIKEWITGQDRKKLIENTAIVIIIGVIIIIAGSAMLNTSKGNNASGEKQQSDTSKVTEPHQVSNTEVDLEGKLKTLLSQVKGVGKVDVMITYSATKESVPAYEIKKGGNSTDEQDSEGGTRKVREEEYESVLAYEDLPEGGKAPVVIKQLEPEVKGVLVVAEGADSVEVRDRICNAVTVVLDVPVHKVQVVQRKK